MIYKTKFGVSGRCIRFRCRDPRRKGKSPRRKIPAQSQTSDCPCFERMNVRGTLGLLREKSSQVWEGILYSAAMDALPCPGSYAVWRVSSLVRVPLATTICEKRFDCYWRQGSWTKRRSRISKRQPHNLASNKAPRAKMGSKRRSRTTTSMKTKRHTSPRVWRRTERTTSNNGQHSKWADRNSHPRR